MSFSNEVEIVKWWVCQLDELLSEHTSCEELLRLIGESSCFGSLKDGVPSYYAIVNQVAHDLREFQPLVEYREITDINEFQLKARLSFARDSLSVLHEYYIHCSEKYS